MCIENCPEGGWSAADFSEISEAYFITIQYYNPEDCWMYIATRISKFITQ
jgi:hypothetical protein